ncbi:MAG: hypothetical protein PQJ58_19520 [Spirochaetales bacterium]|nr:hypothetical protein [Spirochaetales bacterium]
MNKSRRFIETVLTAGLFLSLLSCGSDGGPSSPYVPVPDDEEKTWQELLADDPSYPPNVYLTEFIEWSPGLVGLSRQNPDYSDSEGRPLAELTLDALGPPEGSGAATSGNGKTCPVGINGWAVWKFDPDYVIVDGPGNDFITFTKTFAWGRAADSLCNELAFVEVSEDGTTWYELDPAKISYDTNPQPETDNDNYVYANVSGLHGNAPTWANFRTDVQAEELSDVNGTMKWIDVVGVSVSRYFSPDDDYLGGIAFDLADFISKDDSSPWPAGGKMRYLKIIDSSDILDGQDYAKDWCLGANLMSAMGINTEPSGGS